MADSFILKGDKKVIKAVGNVTRLNPPRGGDIFKFPQWWSLKQNTQYLDVAKIALELDSGTAINLIIPVDNSNSEISVKHDGQGNFTFPYVRGIDRVAVINPADKSLYREYQFPSIAKGPVLTVIKAAYPTVTPLSLALTSSDFTDSGALPTDVGVDFGGANPTSPALSWALAGDNAADVVSYQLRVVDTDAANYIHWSVDGIGSSVTSIAASADPVVNNWSGSPTINATGGGGGAALANGWEPVAPPAGDTHNYQFQIEGLNSGGTVIVSSNTLTGTYTTAIP
jgi:phosphatidylethanolamine-binding protein (PEBP) family uncharacterized protein